MNHQHFTSPNYCWWQSQSYIESKNSFWKKILTNFIRIFFAGIAKNSHLFGFTLIRNYYQFIFKVIRFNANFLLYILRLINIYILMNFMHSCRMKLIKLTCIIIAFSISPSGSKFCSDENAIVHDFHPLRHCQRSNKSVIAFSNVDSLDDCIEYARSVRGLAFNFSSKDRYLKNRFEIKKIIRNNDFKSDSDVFFNCEVLGCPEFRNFSTIINDTRFDYYSLYTRPPREYKSIVKNFFLDDFCLSL